MPLILGTNSIKDTGYNVANSCRFDSATDAHLHITYGSAGNQKKWSWSGWVKRGTNFTTQQNLFAVGSANNNFATLNFNTASNIVWYQASSGGTASYLETDAIYRDPGAWMHILLSIDTTLSTANNRNRLWVNGTEITSFTYRTNFDQNADGQINDDVKHYLGGTTTGLSNLEWDGYMAEVVFQDGVAHTGAGDFGEFDSDSPTIWKPKDVSGLTFGSNGFYLDFEDSSALGNDISGNNNDLTVSNIAATDQSIDTCTNNFATINPLTPVTATLTEGNLKFANTATNHKGVAGTFGASSGKWYCEIKTTDVSDSTHVGIIDIDQQENIASQTTGYSSRGYSLSHERDVYNNNGIISGYTDWTGTYGDGDILGIAMDLDNDKLYFSKGGQWSAGDGTWGSTTFNASTAAIPITAGYTYTFGASVYNGNSEFNFGSPPFSISSGNADANGFGNFEYAVPSGYFALCTKNLAENG